MEISLPVSVGEALDKYSILVLKSKYIKDVEKILEINREIEKLDLKLKNLLETYKYQYNCLLKINEEIWLDQDKFRIEKDTEKYELCKKIIVDNDRRFRVKNKLNILTCSDIKEQKSYPKKRAFIFHHLGMGDMFTMNGAVRLISTYYDKTTVVCKDMYKISVKQMYSDDPSIDFYIVKSDQEERVISRNLEKLKEISNNSDLFLIGVHKINSYKEEFLWNIQNITANYFFERFYQDIGLKYSDRFIYQHINRDKTKEQELFNKVTKDIKNYIFVHDSASNYKLDIQILKKYLYTDDVLVFNPNRNFYEDNKDHPFYNTWKDTYSDLLDYSLLIENADQLHLVDSAFYCLACCLNLRKDQIRFVYSREKTDKEGFHNSYDNKLFSLA